jgi:hypothetical protein
MRFKKRTVLWLACCLYISPVFAGLSHIEKLNREATLARQVLEHQYGLCRALRDREVNYFDFWLQAQRREVKVKMLRELSEIAFNNCIKPQSDAYTLIVVRLAAISKDKSKLEEWLDLYPEDNRDDFTQTAIPEYVFEQQLQRLSQSPTFHFPFNPMDASNTIIHGDEKKLMETLSETVIRQPYIQGLIPSPY